MEGIWHLECIQRPLTLRWVPHEYKGGFDSDKRNNFSLGKAGFSCCQLCLRPSACRIQPPHPSVSHERRTVVYLLRSPVTTRSIIHPKSNLCIPTLFNEPSVWQNICKKPLHAQQPRQGRRLMSRRLRPVLREIDLHALILCACYDHENLISFFPYLKNVQNGSIL